MNTTIGYYPEVGTGPHAAVELLRNSRSAEVASAELATVMRCEIKNVSGSLARAVDSGLLVKRREGRACFYSYGNGTPPDPARDALLQQANHGAIARMAVVKLKGQMLGSVALAIACHTTPEVIDAALAPLVDAHKLTRISVLRSGVEMFDYRYSATWVPKDADFAFNAPDAAPHPALSPVAPPTIRRVSVDPLPRPAPAKPAPKPAVTLRELRSQAAPPTQPYDALVAGGELGRGMGMPIEQTAAKSSAVFGDLGWIINPVETIGGERATHLDEATLDAAMSLETVPNILEADDMVMALNSRGEFVIDLGGGDLVKFPPAQALCLKRFLDNTSVLEDLAAQGAV